VPDKFDQKTRSKIMSSIRSTTSLEANFKRLLRKNKIKGYKSNYKMLGKPDLVSVKEKIVIFIDGDFWHGYNWKRLHKVPPKVYWQNKIRGNIIRDKKYTSELRRSGWNVLRFWEHDIKSNPEKCLVKLIRALK